MRCWMFCTEFWRHSLTRISQYVKALGINLDPYVIRAPCKMSCRIIFTIQWEMTKNINHLYLSDWSAQPVFFTKVYFFRNYRLTDRFALMFCEENVKLSAWLWACDKQYKKVKARTARKVTRRNSGLQSSRLMRRATPLLIQWSGVTPPDLSSTLMTYDARPAPPERTGK